ncbi:TPA: hypothetical protein DEP93_01455 [candidate division WWE3 bacterium]|uniref:Uncharacterized protein n=1 Tax=candidate division WWE3 bacterium TaxID=2053526 RepID=A0A3D0ZP87_UNCKA|nr:MAG: hypothetical protein A2245_03855 [candidate division WWE3 bacterium RIFOXYA2_FULL_43_12]OGC72434.1 MAG: hypothetical protein A2337_02760 [candidate division WWE3 bacterium RIFOXYB2_FULL_43_9]OGC75148.1 MAG: hypothetical protein A2547_01855 [candidate division WWE3 bacterium RIFOXYD2_FULL_43_10]HCC42117.1 hypothetical protein [candidate division WWE3 bacterium]
MNNVVVFGNLKVGEEQMTTVVNNPAPEKESSGSGFFAGIVLLIIFLGVVLYFAIPAIRNMQNQPIQVNVPAPQINMEAPKVEVPAPQGEPAPVSQ